jgi:hypothetical protein
MCEYSAWRASGRITCGWGGCTRRLESSILVMQTVDHVWAFFEDISNLPKWDRSVARVVPTSPGPIGLGYTFDTIAPSRGSGAQKEGLRMSYRITEIAPKQRYSVLLVVSTMFKDALWTFVLENLSPRESGSSAALSSP